MWRPGGHSSDTYRMSETEVKIEELTTEERLDLLERVRESLQKDPGAVPLTPAQRRDFDRRLDEIEQGDTTGIPWEEVVRQF